MLRCLILVAFAALAPFAHGQPRTEIYKCVDASGRASYTNDSRETDGRPDLDGGNDPGRHILRARAMAVDRDGARRVVEAELVRVCLEGRPACEPGIRVQSQREIRHALP